MSQKSRPRPSILVLGLLLGAPSALLGCDTIKQATSFASKRSCDGLESGDFSELKVAGAATNRVKVVTFLEAVHSLDVEVKDLTKDLSKICYNVIKAVDGKKAADKAKKGPKPKKVDKDSGLLGAASAINSAVPDSDAKVLERLCKGAATSLGKVKANVSVTVEPPKCSADVGAFSECLSECGAVIEPGKLEASCKGEVSGKCEGECSGECEGAAEASCTGTCSGTCEGTCEGSFSGTCEGKCSGSCDGTAIEASCEGDGCESEVAEGNCAGQCEGKCEGAARGSCSGECGGSCDAECEASASAKCDGTCKGECSVAMTEPKCTGEFDPPKVDADCHAACMSEVQTTLSCTKPAVNAEIEASGKLRAVLEKSVPAFVDIVRFRSKRLIATAASVGNAGSELKGSLGDVGSEAVACISAGIAMTATASVDVKASVSASVDAKAVAGGSF